jgi:D-arginine dehydrogenase
LELRPSSFSNWKKHFSNWKTGARLSGSAQKAAAMDHLDSTYDCIVIGAGIAGASVAAELSAQCKVLLLERESQPGYHTTGRSAALYTQAYGPPIIRALTRASGPYFHNSQNWVAGHPWLHPRGALFFARSDQTDALDALQNELGDAVSRVSASDVYGAIPLFRPGYVAAGLMDHSASDIDVNGVHHHYLKAFRAAGGTLCTNAEVLNLTRSGDWEVETQVGTFKAPIVVNASGAWADEIAMLAGVARAGLTPKRRTVLMVSAPDGVNPDAWPMAVDVQEECYLKPDAGKLLISPADATPSPPCDAQPDEMDVAICVDRIERAFDLSVRRIDSKWAGVRSCLPDGGPLAAFDPGAPGFFWLAGQGGYGIQSAPALARVAAALVMGQPIPGDIADQGVQANDLGRGRQGLAA